MSKWQEKRLGEVASDVSYGYTESATFDIIGPKFLRITDITNDLINWNTVPYCKINDKDMVKYKLQYNDIVIARTGATTGINKQINKIIDAVFASYLIRFRINDRIANPKYVYHYLQTSAYKGFINNYISGSAQPGINATVLSKFKITLPDIKTQEKIADILSTYDDLIENNNRRIDILEQMAQEIYKEWFVRFRFPGHEKVKFVNGIPEGWEVKKIKDIVDRKPFGTLYKESQVQEDGKVIVIDQSKKDYIGFHNNEPSHNADIEKPMILFGDHSCKYKIMIRPFSLAENVIPFTSNDENLLTTYYLFYSINGIIQTTEYKRHWTDLTNKKIIISNINLQTKFEEKIKEFLLEIEQLSIINRNLIKQRDLLLPRLMSGKLEV